MLEKLLEVTKAAFAWIDAVPDDTVLPAMPGFDRDWADAVISEAEKSLEPNPLTCPECGGKMGKHFLNCSVWGFSR